MILASTQVHEPLLCVLRSRQDVVCLESGPYACLLGRVSGTWSQNSSENYLIAALAARGVAWLMGQRNSFGTLVFFFFPFSLLRDTESCFLVIGLNGAYPEQMGNSL